MSNSCECLVDSNTKCACTGYTLDKLLQPNILTLLAVRSLHGYSIIQEFENRDHLFRGEKVDNTGIYRALKTLEGKGMVRSEWELESGGPAKRIYSITEAGISCLATWVETLNSYRSTIEIIIEEAEAALGRSGS